MACVPTYLQTRGSSLSLSLSWTSLLNLHDESVDHGDVVSHPGLGCVAGAVLKVGPQFREERYWSSVLQETVQVLLELRLDQRSKVGHHPRGDGDLGQHVHLK